MGVQLMNAEIKCEKIYESVEKLVVSPVKPISEWAVWLSTLVQKPVDAVVNIESLQENTAYSWSLSVVSLYDVAKAKVVDEIIEDKAQVRDSICEIIASNVEKNIQKWLWIIPTMVLLFLIVSPLVSLAFRVFSVVSWLLLKLLIAIKAFSWIVHMKETKELE